MRLSPKVYRFLNQRRHADRLSIQQILAAGIAAYIVGDLEVTHEGYRVRPARAKGSPSAIIEHADGTEETFTLEDAQLAREIVHEATARPQEIGLNRRNDGEVWGTRELAAYLREETGRYIGMDGLRGFLRRRFPKPEGQREWRWSGPDDPQVAEIAEGIQRHGLFGDRDLRALGVTKRDLSAAQTKHDEHRRQRQARGRRRAARSTG